MRKKNPDAEIIVTGCAAQINPQTYANLPQVDKVIGNKEKFNKDAYFSPVKMHVSDIMQHRKTTRYAHGVFKEQTRAFVEVQNGCNHRCTFCIIPYGRGNARSQTIEDVIESCKNLVKNGHKEIILSGVDLTSGGEDLPQKPHLGELVHALLKNVPELPRLRLSSIDVAEIDAQLLDIIKNEERFMPHLHLSIQSGDNMILKRMKRRHTREQAIDMACLLRDIRPNISLGADIICGFPTEDEAMFQNTYNLLQTITLEHAHIFPFSAKIGTPAAKIPHQLSIETRKNRAKFLRDAQKIIRKKWLETFINTSQDILLEKNNKGYTPHFAPVMLRNHATQNYIGDIVKVKILTMNDEYLLADNLLSS